MPFDLVSIGGSLIFFLNRKFNWCESKIRNIFRPISKINGYIYVETLFLLLTNSRGRGTNNQPSLDNQRPNLLCIFLQAKYFKWSSFIPPFSSPCHAKMWVRVLKKYMIFQVFYFKLYIYFIFLPIEHPYSSDGLAGGILNMVFSYQDSAEKK